LVPGVYDAKDGLFSLDCDEYNLCGELKDFVDKGEAEWVGPSTAYALLSNAEIFWVDIKDVVRFHGGCAIVKTELYASEISQQAGYFEDVAVIATEKRMRKLSGKVIAKSEVQPGKIKSITLDRFDVSGQLWFRRRYQLPDEPTYSFIQWMDAKVARLKEKPTAIKLSDISSRLDSMEKAVESTQKDMTEVKDLIKNYTTLVGANLAQAEVIKEFVKDQKSSTESLIRDLASLRSELRTAAV